LRLDGPSRGILCLGGLDRVIDDRVAGGADGRWRNRVGGEAWVGRGEVHDDARTQGQEHQRPGQSQPDRVSAAEGTRTFARLSQHGGSVTI
jgi:hypothetical protein